MRIWERSEGREGIAPIPPELDEWRFELRLAKLLNVPVWEVGSAPLHYRTAAALQLQVDALHHRQTESRLARRRKTGQVTPRSR